MHKIIILFIIALTIHSCSNSECYCETDESLYHNIDSKIDSLKNTDYLDWYEKTYSEPKINNADHEYYRLTINVANAGSSPIFIYRIGKSGDSEYYFKYKEYDFYDNSLQEYKDTVITNDHWNDFLKTLETNCFWSLTQPVQRPFLEGATSVINGFKPTKDQCSKRKFHAVYRTFMNDTTDFTRIYDQFISLKADYFDAE